MVDLEELEKLVAGEHCTEWRPCGNDRGGCKCGLIWSTSCDVVVAQVPTDGGDLKWSEAEQFHRARLICALRNAAPELIAEIRKLRTERDWYRQQFIELNGEDEY